jgi:phage baseplate assembly protein W
MALSPLQKKRELYADFHKDLTLNPVNFDLARKLNEESVKESIKNLLLTDKGERFYRPNLGSNIRNALFDNATPDSIFTIQEMVKNTIKNYEPRCNIIEVEINSSIDENEINIVITFSVANQEYPIQTAVTLTRVR